MLEAIKKNTHILFLSGILILGLALRLISIDKPGGLWHDEIELYTSAAGDFPFGILEGIKQTGVHPPLYYFLVHFGILLFGNDDVNIRLFSVLFGILTIFTGYLIGCQLKSRELGLITSLFIAINSLFIFYSQEVRFYSCFIFCISLSILFLLRVYNNPSKKNYIGWVISNILCLYTSSLGLLFILIEIFVYSIYLIKDNKDQLKIFIITSIIPILTFLPYLGSFIRQYNVATNGLISIFNIMRLTPLAVIYSIQDWFSPLPINIFGYAPDQYYFEVFSKPDLFFTAVLIVFFPMCICFTGIFKAVATKNAASIILFSIALIFFLTEVYFTITGRLSIISRYTLPSVLTFVILASYGLYELKSIKLKRVLIINYVIISLFILIFTNYSAARIDRLEGLKYATDMLYNYNISPDDLVLMPYAGRYIKKYDKDSKFRIADKFDILDTYFFPDQKKLEYVFDTETIKKLNNQNAYELLYPYITSTEAAAPQENYFNSDVLTKIKPGNRLFLVISRGVGLTPPEDLPKFKQDKNRYYKTSLLTSLTTKHYNDFLKMAFENLTYVDKSSNALWDVYVFVKQ